MISLHIEALQAKPKLLNNKQASQQAYVHTLHSSIRSAQSKLGGELSSVISVVRTVIVWQRSRDVLFFVPKK